MASGLTRNQVPRKGLRVRIPCPPLGNEGFLVNRSVRSACDVAIGTPPWFVLKLC